MSKKVEKSRGAKALYSRKEYLVQAKNDKKIPIALSSFVYLIFTTFATISDFLSVQPFQDRILRVDEQTGYVLTSALIFCIDIVVPLMLPNLLQTHFNHKKLKFITLISIISSVGLLIVLNLIQKIVGANVMIPNSGEEVIVGNGLKLITLALYGIVPLASTIALTAMSIQRNHYKLYQKMRYCILAEADVEAQLHELQSRIKRDEEKLQLEDDIRFITTIGVVKCKAEIMFNFARIILAESKSSEEAERILSSEHLQFFTDYDDAIRMNPNRKVSFVESNEKDDTTKKNKED